MPVFTIPGWSGPPSSLRIGRGQSGEAASNMIPAGAQAAMALAIAGRTTGTFFRPADVFACLPGRHRDVWYFSLKTADKAKNMSSQAATSIPRPLRVSLCLVLAGVCAALHIWKLAPALPALQADLGLDLVESGFLLSIVQLAGMTLGLLIGLMAERIGRRRCIMAGLAILAMASLMSIGFSSTPMMLLFRSIEGCGFLMVVLPVPSIFRHLLPASMLSRIMGLWSCYIPIGSILILISGAWVISMADWRLLWLLLTAVTLAMLLLVWAVVPRDAPFRLAKVNEPGAPKSSALKLLRLTLGSGSVWLVALTFGAYSAQWMAVIGFLPTIYATADITGTMAGVLTGLVAGANIIGNLLAGQLLHRRVPAVRLIMIGFLAMITSAFIAFGVHASAVIQFVAVVSFSAVGGLIPATLFMLAITVAPTPQTTTTTVGWLQQGSALGQFSGPPAVAWAVNLAGGWQWTWAATGAYALTGIALALALDRKVRASAVC